MEKSKKIEEFTSPSKRSHQTDIPFVDIEHRLKNLLNTHKTGIKSANAAPSREDISEVSITVEELRKAVKALRKRKAAGLDGISNEHIIYSALTSTSYI